MKALLLWYDSYHTPVAEIAAALPDAELVLLTILVDDAATDAPDALEHVIVDARERFAEQYLARAIRSNACYQTGYYLSAALSRPLMAEVCNEEAARHGADTVIHGLAGNDALRFVTGMTTLCPGVRLINVAELCGSRTRANGNGWTISSNLWGRSIEAGSLGDPDEIAPSAAAGGAARDLEITWSGGVPTHLDGSPLRLSDAIARLDAIGAPLGIGRCDLVEDGHVGLKTRAVYDAPAAAMLVTAHADLERFVCTSSQNRFKRLADEEWTRLVYDGLWFDPARDALEKYINFVNRRVTGTVRLRLQPGGVSVIARRSPCAVYDESYAVYRAGHDFGQTLIDEIAEQQSVAARLARRDPNIGFHDRQEERLHVSADLSAYALRCGVQHQSVDGPHGQGRQGAEPPPVE